ncbi:hypothetical protein [Candidatus Nitrosotalea bavarica]|uniref:hypothetical protein n=1 Tax=Candidatus Nitrosotalea bavarica TaxID=1903277 RepID=UPI000C6FEE52|nr:hypothetical protein [Candidatus Nitrosotalea bavarica]
MQFAEIANSLLDTYNCIDIRTASLLQNNSWHAFLVVIRFRREKMDQIEKEYKELTHKHGMINERDFRVDLSVLSVKEWGKICDNWGQNFLLINSNFRVSVENRNELCHELSAPLFVGTTNYVDTEWDSYLGYSYVSAHDVYNKIRVYDKRAQEKFFRDIIEYLGMIFQINKDDISFNARNIICAPVFFKLSKATFHDKFLSLRCVVYPTVQLDFVVNLYKRLGNTTPIPKDKQTLSHKITGDSSIKHDFEVEIPLDSFDVLDEFRIDVYKKSVLIGTLCGTVGSYVDKTPETIQIQDVVPINEKLEPTPPHVEINSSRPNVPYLIKKLEEYLKRLQDIDKPNQLPDIAMGFRTLLKAGFTDGKERLDEYVQSRKNIEKRLPSSSQTSDLTEITRIDESNFKLRKNWLKAKIKEVMTELRHIEAIEQTSSNGKPYSENARFLDITNTTDAFYTKLIREINLTYHYELYSSAQMLIRKLFENLVIDILRKKYKNDTSSYLNSKDRYHQFHIIITNAKERIEQGDFDNVKRDFKETLDWISKLRDEGNKSAHSITFDVKKPELDKIHDEIIRNVDLLNRIFSIV